MRYGGVAYLNARPLLEGLKPLTLDTPSRLSERFSRDEVDVALLPVAAGEASGRPRVGALGIASFGRVGSVLLFLRKPVREVKTLALDPSSRSSRILAQLVLAQRYGVDFAILSSPGDAAKADAELVIGDAALVRAERGTPSLDLAEEWTAWTGLPFVFAAWYGAADAAPELERAWSRGRVRLAAYASEAARTLGLPAAGLERYLRESIRFRLGSAELEGLSRFREEALGRGLL